MFVVFCVFVLLIPHPIATFTKFYFCGLHNVYMHILYTYVCLYIFTSICTLVRNESLKIANTLGFFVASKLVGFYVASMRFRP